MFSALLFGVVAVTVVVVLGLLLLPQVQGPREASPRMSCSNNLKQIGLSLYNYHDTYGSFPPAYIADENGVPIHSWRTLLLPFAEQIGLYEQIRFDEPWNSPWNRKLYDGFVPDFYACPSGLDNQCSYFIINLPDGVFEDDNTTSIDQITDGTTNTILVVEVVGATNHWAEPVDLGPEALDVPINFSRMGNAISSPHAGGAMVLMGDCRVRFIPDDTTLEDLKAMLTKSGGEQVELP